MADTFLLTSYGDVTISMAVGQPTLISGSQKFSQDMSELLAVNVPIGAGLGSLIGTVPDNPLIMSALGDQRIRNAADNYQALQQGSPQIPRLPNEILADVPLIQFTQQVNDPTSYNFYCQFMTQQGLTLPKVGILTPGTGG
jgi:hypothetical protein